MTWAYLLVFNEKVGARAQVQDFLNSVPEVTFWYGCLPSAIFLTSTLPAGQISDKLKERFGSGSGQRWFITEVHQDRQGWVPKQVWHMVKNPTQPKLPKSDA